MPGSRKCEPRFAASFLKPTRDLNFKCLAQGKGATVTARFGPDGLAICAPNSASEGADEVFQKIYKKAICNLCGKCLNHKGRFKTPNTTYAN